mmetsp:Transcript_54632/g.155493  ORF Transcript_54632/g.155493 Transcript_54632/m.155493 type:complete len:212 (+) Transcript_54632:153-788(+)
MPDTSLLVLPWGTVACQQRQPGRVSSSSLVCQRLRELGCPIQRSANLGVWLLAAVTMIVRFFSMYLYAISGGVRPSIWPRRKAALESIVFTMESSCTTFGAKNELDGPGSIGSLSRAWPRSGTMTSLPARIMYLGSVSLFAKLGDMGSMMLESLAKASVLELTMTGMYALANACTMVEGMLFSFSKWRRTNAAMKCVSEGRTSGKRSPKRR